MYVAIPIDSPLLLWAINFFRCNSSQSPLVTQTVESIFYDKI